MLNTVFTMEEGCQEIWNVPSEIERPIFQLIQHYVHYLQAPIAHCVDKGMPNCRHVGLIVDKTASFCGARAHLRLQTTESATIHSKSEDPDLKNPAKKIELSTNLSKNATKWSKNGQGQN